MNEQEQTPELQIDSDWKAEAQAEMDRLAAEEAKLADSGGAAASPQGMPEPTFKSLVGMLATQALMGLGVFGDQKSGSVAIDLDGSRFHIDLLDMLAKKTEGNLEAEEAKELQQLLAELRARYVQISELLAKQIQSGIGPDGKPIGGGGGASPDSTTPPAGPVSL